MSCYFKSLHGVPWYFCQLSMWFLILIQVIIFGLWDGLSHWVPLWVWSLLWSLSLPLPLASPPLLSFSYSLSQKKKGYKREDDNRYSMSNYLFECESAVLCVYQNKQTNQKTSIILSCINNVENKGEVRSTLHLSC